MQSKTVTATTLKIRQAMYVWNTAVALSRKHFHHGNAKARSFVLLTYVCRCQQCNLINIEKTAMEEQEWVLCIVALHMSLPTIRKALRSSYKAPDIFVGFSQRGLHNSPQYQILRKSVQWEPPVHADKRTDRHVKANRHFSRLRRTRLEILTLTDDFVSLFCRKQHKRT